MHGTVPVEIAAERVMPADVDAAWQAVADAGRYADHVTLAKLRVESLLPMDRDSERILQSLAGPSGRG